MEYQYIKNHCPNLLKRMEKDSDNGVFSWNWVMNSDESMKYIGMLAGREIKRTEVMHKTFEEVEEKLKKQQIERQNTDATP